MEKSKDYEVMIYLNKNRIGTIEDYVIKALKSQREIFNLNHDILDIHGKALSSLRSQLDEQAEDIRDLRDELRDAKATIEMLKAGYGE